MAGFITPFFCFYDFKKELLSKFFSFSENELIFISFLNAKIKLCTS